MVALTLLMLAYKSVKQDVLVAFNKGLFHILWFATFLFCLWFWFCFINTSITQENLQAWHSQVCNSWEICALSLIFTSMR